MISTTGCVLTLVPVMARFMAWFDKNSENKLLAVVAGVVLGVVLRDLVPYLWRSLGKLLAWFGKQIGGRFGFRYFEKSYLNWLVTDLRELKLAGIVSSDATKKPKLEQVFVSLRVGEQPGKTSVVEITQAVIEELRRRPKSALSVMNALRMQLESVSTAERKDSEQLLREFLPRLENYKMKIARFVDRHLLHRQLPGEDHVLDMLFSHREFSTRIPENGPKADLAAILFRKILRDQPRIAILGTPGSGKTTLLQFVGLAYAKVRAGDPKLRDQNAAKTRLGTDRWRIPIFISLSSIASKLVDPLSDGRQPSIIDVLPQTLPPDLQTSTARLYFMQQLRKGNCIILLDGLDEVPTEAEFRAVTRAIESMAITYDKNQYIVTSRIAGWRTGVGADFRQHFVNELSDDQIESFIRTWYSAVELNAVIGNLKDESETDRINRDRRAAKHADKLRTALRENPGIRQLATNPMLLSIIALVHRSLTNLPQERAKLYADCVKILLEQWDVLRGVHVDDTQLSLEQKEAVIRRIAYALHTGEIGTEGGGKEASREEVEKIVGDFLPDLGKPMLESSRLLGCLMERSGLLIERQRDRLAFAHLTFQEYFTAKYLARGDRAESREFLLVPSRLLSDWWRETILLYSGMLPDSGEFVRRVHAANDGADMLGTRIRLAAACLGEAVQIKDTQIRQKIGKDLIIIRTRGQISEVLEGLSPELIDSLIKWSRQEEWYSHFLVYTFQTAPQESKNKVFEEIAKLLDSEELSSARAALDALRYVPGSIISEALIIRVFRFFDSSPKLQALAGEILPGLVKMCVSADVVEQIVSVLRQKNPSMVIAGLSIALEAAPRLKGFESVTETVAHLFTDPNWRVRQDAAKVFDRTAQGLTSAQFNGLVKLLSDDDSDVVREAAQALTNLTHSHPPANLLEKWLGLLSDANENVRAFAVRMVGETSMAEAQRLGVVSRLVAVYGDKSESVGDAIISTLRALSERGLREEIVSNTLAVMRTPGHAGRPCGLRVLGQVGPGNHDTAIASAVLSGLRCRDLNLRCAAAAAVENSNLHEEREQIVSELFELAESRRKAVRIAALRALGAIAQPNRDQRIIQIINSALRDKNWRVRAAAAQAAARYGRNGKEFVTNLLLDVSSQALEESPFNFRFKPGIGLFREHFFLSSVRAIDYGRSSLQALTAIGSAVETERIMSELYEIAASAKANPISRSFIIETIGTLGAKAESARALEYLVKLLPRVYEAMSHLRGLWHFRGPEFHDGYFFLPGIDDDADRAFNEPLLSVARKVEPNKAAKDLKSILEAMHIPLKLMALDTIGQMDPRVSSDLLPVVLKRANDDAQTVREKSWEVLRQIYIRRGYWKAASSAPPAN